ncbi:MAG: hypothetical protein JNK30_09000 [Phenylobacterium sp.]|nr:hypothetical protein [Phenylobacterium sp.]
MAHAAEGQDIEGFERCGRTANAFARTVGQVVLLKQRFDREQAEAAAGARREAEAAEVRARKADEAAREHHRKRVDNRLARLVWGRFGQVEALDVWEDLEPRLAELAHDDDFLATPVEALVQRLADEFDLHDQPDGDDDADTHDAAYPADVGDFGPVPEAAPEPPPRPPDPPPEPYIPPWEKLRPGQIMRDSGW